MFRRLEGLRVLPILRPYPAYKPSGVLWLGDVPAQWEVGHLRRFANCLDGTRVPLSAVERDTMQGSIPYWGANNIIDYVNDWLFDEPLVLLGEDGAPFFESNRDVSFFTSGKVWVNNHIHVLRCGRLLNPQFLPHVLNRVDYTNFISGSTRDKLTQQSMGDIPLQIPPLAEQASIVRLPRPRGQAHPALQQRQAEAHRPAAGGEAGHHQPGRHPWPRPQRPPQALRRRVAGRRAGALETVSSQKRSVSSHHRFQGLVVIRL